MFVDEWRWLVRRSWCLRFVIIAGLFSGLEVALPLLSGNLIPEGLCAVLSFAAVCAAYYARLIAQKRDGSE